jgi:hypothetical protein
MAYGFEATNSSGKVIVNDTMENLHFIGKATKSTATDSDYGDFPGYSGAYDALDGRVIHTYTVTCSGTPFPFIKPNDYTRWHAVIKQSVSGTTWTFEVMISGTSTSNPPDVYCFVNADDIPSSSETHGMQVFKADGTTKTFDSRKQPLAITGGGTTVPPSDPTDGTMSGPFVTGTPSTTWWHPWNYATNDHDFRSSTRYNSTSLSGTYTDLMFSAPSLAQAVYKRQMDGRKWSCWGFGIGCQYHFSSVAWWVMYRNAFRIRSGYFDAGWTGYAAGYSFSSAWESGGWFGGGGGSYSTGTMPYLAKTINLFSNAYIIADASRYS